jgi:glycosyltransferase involved in cell wall biosynthesis
VVVTCYDLGRYLDEAVDSVLAQTFQDLEILVVDDGSTEPDTVRLLADYRRPRTRVVRSENRGLPGARNLGVRETSGPYVCTLDADDRLAPTFLEKSVAVLDRDPSVAFVSHWLETFGDEAWEWKPESCELLDLLDRNTVNGSALVRREALLAVGGFDESMRQGCEDWALWLEMVHRGSRGVILPEVLFHYRRRADSMSRAMVAEGAYVSNFRRLVARYEPSYRRHFAELLVRRERRSAELRREIHDLLLERESVLGRELSWARHEIEALRRKGERRTRPLEPGVLPAPAPGGNAGWERLAALAPPEVEQLRREIKELRASMSWRVTAPLRAVYGWLLRLSGRGPG